MKKILNFFSKTFKKDDSIEVVEIIDSPPPLLPKNLVQQRHRYDDPVACIAMLTNHSYDYIKDNYFPNHNFDMVNVKHVEFEAILFDMNLSMKRSKTFDVNKSSIIVIPSLNNTKGGVHTVFWDSRNQRVLDPQRGRLYYLHKIPMKYYTTKKFLKSKKIVCFYYDDIEPIVYLSD